MISFQFRYALPSVIAGCLIGVALAPLPARAQGQGCNLHPLQNPSRQVLRCPDGLKIEAEAAAVYTLIDRDRDGEPDGASLQGKALLLETPQTRRGRGFQVLTPQAIAAVRGTQWVVDVDSARTAVLVLTGRVAVQRQGARRAVTLGPGEGVDVDGGTGPLVVRRWPGARVSALLARFGR